DIVTFIVNQGAQIVEFVNAVLDAVIAIANGGAAGVPKMVEAALAASVPLLIGFLASLLGIGSLANKVKSVFHAVSRPVNRAIDKIVNFIAKAGKKLWAKIKGQSKNKETEREESKIKRLNAARNSVLRVLSRGITGAKLRILLSAIKHRHRLRELRVEDQGENKARIYGAINPQFEEFPNKIPVVDKVTPESQKGGVEKAFRAMGFTELRKIKEGQGLNIRVERGKPKGEPGLAVESIYSIHYVRQKQKKQEDPEDFSYAVVVEIEFEEGAISDLISGPKGVIDGNTANKFVAAGDGVIEVEEIDGRKRKVFVFHAKRQNLPKRLPLQEGGRRNVFVYKVEPSHQPGTAPVENYLVVSSNPSNPDALVHDVNARIRRISVIGGVRGQVSPEVVQEKLGG
ncbi:hypothetical protein ACWCQ6_16575, partial [Streptomyces sp. NPDC001880]